MTKQVATEGEAQVRRKHTPAPISEMLDAFDQDQPRSCARNVYGSSAIQANNAAITQQGDNVTKYSQLIFIPSTLALA
jgi:hypothetical protein